MHLADTLILILAVAALLLFFTVTFMSVRWKEKLLSKEGFKRFNENIGLFKAGIYSGIALYLVFVAEHTLETFTVFFEPYPWVYTLETAIHAVLVLLLLTSLCITLHLGRKILRRD
ncbi:MAG: hypothetical protein V3W31_02990 [Thermodesulfobacteriota bacterium]